MTRLVLALTAVAILGGAHTADAKGCHETSDVVGLHHCTRFGMWSREGPSPRLWMDLGYFRHRFTSQAYELGPEAMTLSGPDRLGTSVAGPVLRVMGALGDVFYTGGELEPGFLSRAPFVPGIQPNSQQYIGLHSIVGAHVVIARFALAAELAAGFRHEDFGLCPSRNCTYDASQTVGEVEGRLRVDAFVHPELSVSFMYGRSLIDSNDTTWMTTLTIHARVMDGI